MNKNLKKLNKTKKTNKALIIKAIHQHFKENDIVPTLQEISDATGISTPTISKHMSELTLPSALESYRFLTDDMMKWILKSAEGGNAQSQKLFFQLVHNWRPAKYNDPEPSTQPHSTTYKIIPHVSFYEDNPDYVHISKLKEKEKHKTQEEILNNRDDEKNMLMSNLIKLKGDAG